MFQKAACWGVFLIWIFFSFPGAGLAQDEKIAQLAIQTVRVQMRVPGEVNIKYLEKRESVIPDFFAVKLLLLAADREIPVIVYVDKALEKVIIGNLFIKGENVTRKEAGEPKPRRIDMGQLEIEKSPIRGPAGAKVTIVEFSNFQCPYCLRSWMNLQELIKKNPQDIKYVFKSFPLQAQGAPFELAVMVAATYELSNQAFWLIHDFMFSDEGQTLTKGEMGAVKKKIEQILQDKGYDVQLFVAALEAGKGKKRVEEDLALGNKLMVKGTPTTIINGSFAVGAITDKTMEGFLHQ